MSIPNNPLGDLAPLVVKPKAAWKMLACSNTRGYELLDAGELDSYLDGRSRKITIDSIHRYISRRLAATACSREVGHPEAVSRLAERSRKESANDATPPPRRRGRTRKGDGARGAR
jgi:hypothetical protein